MIEED